MILSLIHAATQLDRVDNHVNKKHNKHFYKNFHIKFVHSQPSAFADKLFNSLSIVITNQIRQLSALNTNQPYPNGSM